MTRYVDTDRAQFEIFKSLPRDTPIEMLNLVEFNDLANYPGAHPLARDGLTGAEAYALYGQHSGPVMQKVGAEIIWRGGFDVTLIGAPDEVWHTMFIARYPTAGAFLAMVTDPDYQKAVVHRTAAVRNSRLIRSRGLEPQGIFA